MSRFNSRAAIAVIAVLAATACFAQAEKPAPMTGEAAAIKKSLEQKFPGAEVRGVSKTPYFGLYEVQLDDRIVYTDAKAKYLVIGAVYDPTRRSISPRTASASSTASASPPFRSTWRSRR